MKRFLYAWVLPVLSGVLLAAALPPFDQGQCGWVGLIPLLFAIDGCRPGEALRRGYLAGLVFFGLTTWWVVYVSWLGVVALIAFLALYFAAGAGFLSQFNRNDQDTVGRNLGAMLGGAAGWVTLEWIRGHFPLGGFGWNGLGVTQHNAVPILQFASYTGVYGLSALVFILNHALYCTARRFLRRIGHPDIGRRLSWEFYLAMGAFCVALLFGIRTITRRPTGDTQQLNLALVQGNIPQTLKFDPTQKQMIFDRYRNLTTLVASNSADLIVWPETATPEALRYDPESYTLVTNITGTTGIPLLTGTIDFEPHGDTADAFNAAMLVRRDGVVAETYRKIHLVPFGEYVPLRKIFPLMKWLTPISDSFERGREVRLFQFNDHRFGVVICFEDTLPGVYREFVRQGAQFMVNLTNDAWFQDSPAARIHLANAAIRCAETQRPLVRCTNHGVTGLVNEHGAVVTRLPEFTAAATVIPVPFRHEEPLTFYTRHGDIFVLGCALVAGAFLLVAWRTEVFSIQSRA